MAEKEYIERSALLDDLDAAMKNSGMGYVVGQIMKRYVKRVPAADVAPVVHAIWIDEYGKTWCSRCDASNKQYKPPYCPHCGARMDGGKHGQA